MRLPGLFEIAVLGLGGYGCYRVYQYAKSDEIPEGDSMASPGVWVAAPAGIATNSGVKITPKMYDFLVKLQAACPGIPIFVTSGERTCSEQASAMMTKYDLAEKKGVGEGAKELHKIYAADDIIDAMLSKPKNLVIWTQCIQGYANAGRPLSPHLGGRGLDLRTYSLQPAQKTALYNAAKALGAKPLQESTPEHLHISLP